MSQHDYESKREIIDLIIEQSRHRRIVPFVGSGISFSTGFPTIAPVIQYLAKVDFAIRFGVYRDRFPPLKDGEKGQEKLVDRYRQHPSQYIRDFGWPNFGGLDADLWTWLEREATSDNEYKNLKELAKRLGINDRNIDELVNDLKGLKKPDHLLALQQWDLRREQEQREEGTAIGIKREWRRWKKWHLGSTKIAKKEDEPKLLYGDWEMLLDKLCEGDFGLVDRLFGELETGLYPAQAHRLLALLQPKLGIPLVLTTNFDSFLERAFTEAGLMPKVFDIHRNAELPDPILVERQLSVLKLHGSAYGLRFGERLRQKLETEARDYIKHYLPMKNELILVLGFSGSERRMMQMLQAIVENDDVNRENPRLIWIQGPGCPGPLFDELTAKEKQITYDKKKVRACEVKHADTFLQELYFKLASSHQALGRAYLSQSNQYLTELKLEVPKKLTKTEESCSLQVFVSKKIENVCSGSWATLAGTAFTQSLRQHRVIWIDL
ncbi:MAG: SIR2 family protein, partial [Methylobacter sp.]